MFILYFYFNLVFDELYPEVNMVTVVTHTENANVIVNSIGEEKIYYVDAVTGDDDNDGLTILTPWLTVQKAASSLVAGETVYIRGGTYNEIVTLANSGSDWCHCITYMPYPGETAIIDGTDLVIGAGMGLLNFSGKSYIKISGLQITNVAGAAGTSTGKGIFGDLSDHIIVEDCYTYNTNSSGIYIQRSNDIVYDNNEVELACNGGNQECMDLVTCYNFEIKYNNVHDSGHPALGAEGIDCKVGCHDGSIHHNTVDTVHAVCIYVDAWDTYSYNISIYKNKCIDSMGAGMSIGNEEGGLLENIQVYNNIVYGSAGAGIVLSGAGGGYSHISQHVSIINNTIYGSLSNAGIWVDSTEFEDLIVRNNICSENTWYQIRFTPGFDPADVTIDHNLIYGTHDDAKEYDGADVIIDDPLFVNKLTGNFHLQLGSPAKDVGSSVGAPSDDYDSVARGDPPEIGAFEYV